MEHSPEPRETTSRFEKLLAALVTSRVDFAPQEGSIRVMEESDLDIFTRMGGRALDDFRPRLRHLDTSGVRIPYLSPADLILLKRDSWREKDKLDVLAMREILAREGGQ